MISSYNLGGWFNYRLPPHWWLAGGALRSEFDETEVSDLDLFMSMGADPKEAEEFYTSRGYEVKFRCPEGKLVTLKKEGRPKVQLIMEFTFTSPEELMDSFDIRACRFVYDGIRLHYYISSIKDAKRKEIKLHRNAFPNATFRRIVKYHDKGNKITRDAIQFYTSDIYKKGNLRQEMEERFYID